VDDAVSAEALPDGKIRVWVHIADATRWVELGTPMATEAETRAASGYAPRGVLPMFPLPVATDLMSLNPGSPRCAVSVTAVIDEHGVAEEYWVGTSTVVVKHAVSEEDAARMLAEEPSKHEGLTLLMEAARRRGALRLQRGAVNVRTPECNVRVHDVDDGEGFVDADEEVNSYGNHGERSAAAVRKLEAARLDVRVTRGDQNDVSQPGQRGYDLVRRAHRSVRNGEQRPFALPRPERAQRIYAKSLARGASGAVHGGAQAVHHARREPRCDTA